MLINASNEIRLNVYNETNIENAANKISSCFDGEVQIPIVKIVDDLGFKVFFQELPMSLNGYLLINGDLCEKYGSDRIMVLNKNNSAKRRRFTLAHELGHFLLDDGAKGVCEYYKACEDDNDNSDCERLVGHFAAALLMPREEFKKRYNACIEENTGILYIDIVKQLSDIFNVPYKAVERRFIELGINHFPEKNSSNNFNNAGNTPCI